MKLRLAVVVTDNGFEGCAVTVIRSKKNLPPMPAISAQQRE
jgi:hypothetical protein